MNESTEIIPNTTYSGNDVADAVVWYMPDAASIIAIVYLVSTLVVGSTANCLLIIIINYSPALKTPANSHLINICANNLVLCLCMIISLTSILLPPDFNTKINILTGFHVFLTMNCFLQYWGTFASIGYYRSKIIRSPSLVLKRRRQIITRCLAASWATSIAVSLIVCLAHIENDMYACATFNPFQKAFYLCDDDVSASSQRVGITAVSIVVFCFMSVIIVTSYRKVFKTLNKGNPFGQNRVVPLTRSFSLPSEVGELVPQLTTNMGTTNVNVTADRTIYSVMRKDILSNELIVHYQRHDSINVMSFEDILALENPILATRMRRQILQKRPLQLTRSNTSNASVKSKCPDFTDISAGGDLQRYQNMKNKSAIRNHLIRRDKVGFNSATKNSLVMLASFLFCSLPMFICIVPAVLSRQKETHRVLILLITQLTFCLNSPIYPLWYLIQNKRVRKCLIRVMDSVCVKLDIRR